MGLVRRGDVGEVFLLLIRETVSQTKSQASEGRELTWKVPDESLWSVCATHFSWTLNKTFPMPTQPPTTKRDKEKSVVKKPIPLLAIPRTVLRTAPRKPALPRLGALHKRAFLAVELAKNALLCAFVHHAARLPPATCITWPFLAALCVGLARPVRRSCCSSDSG